MLPCDIPWRYAPQALTVAQMLQCVLLVASSEIHFQKELPTPHRRTRCSVDSAEVGNKLVLGGGEHAFGANAGLPGAYEFSSCGQHLIGNHAGQVIYGAGKSRGTLSLFGVAQATGGNPPSAGDQ